MLKFDFSFGLDTAIKLVPISLLDFFAHRSMESISFEIDSIFKLLRKTDRPDLFPPKKSDSGHLGSFRIAISFTSANFKSVRPHIVLQFSSNWDMKTHTHLFHL